MQTPHIPSHPIDAGAQKCGTTSLYEYLCQHPWVLRAKRRETHYLDWRWPREEGDTGAGAGTGGVKEVAAHMATCESRVACVDCHACKRMGGRTARHVGGWSVGQWYGRVRSAPCFPISPTDHKFFYKALLDENPSCLTGESTPSYLLHSDVVLPRVKALAPQAKLLVVLRCPVARAYSQYRMVVDPEGTPEQRKARGTHWVGKSFEEVCA